MGAKPPHFGWGRLWALMVAVAAFGLAWMHAHAGRLPIATAWTDSVMG